MILKSGECSLLPGVACDDAQVSFTLRMKAGCFSDTLEPIKIRIYCSTALHATVISIASAILTVHSRTVNTL
jgi:hypothetical protein